LALWLKKNGYRADQVQAFLPGPMSYAAAMYHTERNPLRPVDRSSETVAVVESPEQRRLHKAFLRYHDPKNWPLLRKALVRMGRHDLLGPGEHQLIPRHAPFSPAKPPREAKGNRSSGRPSSPDSSPSRKEKPLLTQHTG